jgi:hypothetical protein
MTPYSSGLRLFTFGLLAVLAYPGFTQENVNTTTQIGKVNINRSFQCGDDNTNSTYQEGRVNLNKTIQACPGNGKGQGANAQRGDPPKALAAKGQPRRP